MDSLFPDRDTVLKEEAPGGEWSLYIFGPNKIDDPRQPPEPPLYASFRKKSSEKYIAVPFGFEGGQDSIRIDWDLAGGVCAVFIGDDCYVVFRYGTWKGVRREIFRVAPAQPFTAEEIGGFIREGKIPD